MNSIGDVHIISLSLSSNCGIRILKLIQIVEFVSFVLCLFIIIFFCYGNLYVVSAYFRFFSLCDFCAYCILIIFSQRTFEFLYNHFHFISSLVPFFGLMNVTILQRIVPNRVHSIIRKSTIRLVRLMRRRAAANTFDDYFSPIL